MKPFIPTLAAVAVAGVLAFAPQSASAGAVHVPQTTIETGQAGQATLVHSRRRGYAGAAIAGAVIGGIIAHHAYRRHHRRHYQPRYYSYGYPAYGYRHHGYHHGYPRHYYGYGYNHSYSGAFGSR